MSTFTEEKEHDYPHRSQREEVLTTIHMHGSLQTQVQGLSDHFDFANENFFILVVKV